MSRNRTIIVVTAVVVLTGLFCAGAWMAVASRSSGATAADASTIAGSSRATVGRSSSAGTDRASAAPAVESTTTSVAPASAPAPAPASDPAPSAEAPSSPAPSGSSGSTGGWSGPIGPLPLGPGGILLLDLVAPTIGIPSITCGFGVDTVAVTVTDAGGMGTVWITWDEAGVAKSADLANVGGTSWSASISPSATGWFVFASLHGAVLHAKDAAGNTSTRLVGTAC